MSPTIQIKLLDARIKVPRYATAGSAAVDLCAAIHEPFSLGPGQTALISTGLSVYIGHPDFAGMLLPRSGLGHGHGIVLGNGTGLLDPDYQGPLMVSIWNRSEDEWPYIIQPLARIAQLVFVPILRPQMMVVEEFTDVTARGEGGFGSSGAIQ